MSRQDSEQSDRREFIGLSEIPDAANAVARHAEVVVRRRRSLGLPTCGDDCPEADKLSALVEEIGEVARALHDRQHRLSLREELLDVATAASLWAWAIGEELA